MMRVIPAYPDYYANEKGDIYSTRTGNLRLLPKRMHQGYYRVNVRDRCHPVKHHPEMVHKLVLNAFVGERPEGFVCRHLNGNPKDNRLENLCWGTPSENVQDSMRHGTAVCLRHGENSVAAKLRLQDVKNIIRLHQEGHSLKELASAYSISYRHTADIVNGRAWRKDIGQGVV